MYRSAPGPDNAASTCTSMLPCMARSLANRC